MTTQEQHENTIIHSYEAGTIQGGWVMKCPVCDRTVASGSSDVKKPKWSSCNGLEPKSFSTNKK